MFKFGELVTIDLNHQYIKHSTISEQASFAAWMKNPIKYISINDTWSLFNPTTKKYYRVDAAEVQTEQGRFRIPVEALKKFKISDYKNRRRYYNGTSSINKR